MKMLAGSRGGPRIVLASASLVALAPDLPSVAQAPPRTAGDPAGLRLDARYYQIAVLGLLLGYGMVWLHLEIQPLQAAATLGTVLLTQYAGDVLAFRRPFDPRSALISGLSLCLLLRTNDVALAALTAVVAVASKFVIRVRGKHVFNPTNVAIVLMMVTGAPVWVSPGQWGSVAVFAFLLACRGRAGREPRRADRRDAGPSSPPGSASCWPGRCGSAIRSTIPLHRLQNGALVLFSFFMISDPRTTPDSRAGRILFAVMVALGAYGSPVQAVLDERRCCGRSARAPCWSPSSTGCFPAPAISGAWPRPRGPDKKGTPHETPASLSGPRWPSRCRPHPRSRSAASTWRRPTPSCSTGRPRSCWSRDEDKTVITMANDYQGDPKEFAIVVPVPTVLEKGQIHVADRALIDHLDAYSAPRLVEYFDENPCERRVYPAAPGPWLSREMSSARLDQARAKSLGVTIEAQYTVGEYDILILSAKESAGLETWLRDNGYRIPAGAGPVLGSYLKQGNRFFVAKVNLKEQAKLGFTYLRPIQMAFESPKFMLPIRLGTVNADGPAGALRLHAHPQGPRRDDQLPHGPPADRRGAARPRQGGVPAVLSRDVRRAGEEGGHARGVPRVRVGHGLVRSVRGGSAHAGRAAPARRVLAARRPVSPRPEPRVRAAAASPGRSTSS